MSLRLIFMVIFLCCATCCVPGRGHNVKNVDTIISLPEARSRIIEYHESGQYKKDVDVRAASIIEAVDKALAGQIKYPAVVMMVEDVLLSTYDARKKQGFSDNQESRKYLESNIILSALPAIEPSVQLYEMLMGRNIPVFLISYRPEGMRVSVMENLAKSGFYGWEGLNMMPPNYPEELSYPEEVRRGLQRAGFNIIATVGVLAADVKGDFAGKTFLFPNYMYSMH